MELPDSSKAIQMETCHLCIGLRGPTGGTPRVSGLGPEVTILILWARDHLLGRASVHCSPVPPAWVLGPAMGAAGSVFTCQGGSLSSCLSPDQGY